MVDIPLLVFVFRLLDIGYRIPPTRAAMIILPGLCRYGLVCKDTARCMMLSAHEVDSICVHVLPFTHRAVGSSRNLNRVPFE
jgi:hypothetical protein